jgi:hypothetical protein
LKADRSLLTKGIEIVGGLFAASGGFLIGIAPPEESDAKFAVGVGSFLALIIWLLIKSLAQGLPTKKYKKRWMIASIALSIAFVLSAFIYKQKYDSLVFWYPPERPERQVVAGVALTPRALEYQRNSPETANNNALLLFGFGPENKNAVWPEESVRRAKAWLVGSYLVTVLTLIGSIFTLTEGIWGNVKNPDKTVTK